MIRAFLGACVLGFLGVVLMLVLAVAAGSRPVAATPPQAEREYHFKSTSAALELHERMKKLDAEARCKSSAKRLQSGECD